MMNRSSRKRRLLALLCGLVLASGAARAADPIRYSTYLGGSRYDEGRAIAVDAAGNAYAVGTTLSTDFPVQGGLGNNPNESPHHPLDSFLSELSPDGGLIFSTYLLAGFQGDLYGDTVEDIAVGPGGWIYMTGWIDYGEDVEVFVRAIGPGGGGYTKYLIGEALDQAFSIAVDASGNAYLAGITTSFSFPTEKPNGVLGPGSSDTFVVKLDPTGAVVYVSLLGVGGAGGSPPRIAVDSAGQAIVTGTAGSDAYLAKLNPSGSSFVYFTSLGGGAADSGLALAVDAAGNAYVAGATSSADFPTTAGALQTSLYGAEDLFVAKLDPAGRVVYSTLLGGSGSEQPVALALGRSGGVYLASATSSSDSPLLDPDNPGCRNALVSRLDLQRSLIVGTACVPGATIKDLAVAPDGSVHATGTAEGGLPVVNALQPLPAGEGDAFVTRIDLGQPLDCAAAFASPATLWPPNGKLVSITIQNVIDPDGDPVTVTITAGRQDEPLQGSANAIGIGTSSVSLRADRNGKGDGRVYHLSLTATDSSGDTCTGTVTVCVPHDQGAGKACGDGGPLFNSNGGA
jgi:hypothetical protein